MIPLLIDYIKQQTADHNENNIKRTKAYLSFYNRFPEIKWSLLASFVSRNAGWNMTDLQSETYQNILNEDKRHALYLTYESINWYIFQDAYPQLLIYQLSREKKTPLFFLLKHFHVSRFMENEWYQYYLNGNQKRLLYAQIINEQNVIEQPIIHHSPYRTKVFHSFPFLIQDKPPYNAVILPTENGKLYGVDVMHFLNVSRRIKTGKKIANILFYPYLYPQFISFAKNVPITGSREEYEQYMSVKTARTKPFYQNYRNTKHRMTDYHGDWSTEVNIKKKWWKDVSLKKIKRIDEPFYTKRKWLTQLSSINKANKNESVENS